MTREEAIQVLKEYRTILMNCLKAETPAFDRAIEALTAEPTVIRSKTLMPTKDFKEWAKRVREENQNVIVIPCDAEVVPVETTATNTEKSSNCGDLISRAAAIRWVKTECNPYGKPTLDYDSGLKVIEHLKNMPSALPSADAVSREENEDDTPIKHSR